MNAAQLTALAAEVRDDPASLGYAAWLPDQPGHIVRLMSEQTRSVVASRMVSERGLLDLFPLGISAADALMTRLEAFAATPHPSASIVARALRFLKLPEGLDIGSAGVQIMLGQLVAGGLVTQAEKDALTLMATRPASRCEELGLPPVTEADLRAAGVA